MDERRLRKLFQFTEADLEANRRGQFSEKQRKRLLDQARAEQKSAWESATILFVVAAVGLAFGLILASVAPVPFGRILFVALLCILWPSAWAGKGLQIIRSARTLQEPRLRTVSGRADIIKYDSETYVLKVGELEFDLDGNPSGVIIEGDEYTIYYVEATHEILAVEF
ncbi:MAG TPA: hypothetical protein VFQ23_24350 [Anaerolineales bacterium]|nr:hypothetical protein [Anaerolineales bacterium]